MLRAIEATTQFVLIRKFWIWQDLPPLYFGKTNQKKNRFFCKGNFGIQKTPQPLVEKVHDFFLLLS